MPDRDRLIYSYPDGTTTADGSPCRVHADPMVLYRKWRKALAADPALEPNLKRLGFIDPEDEEPGGPVSEDILLDAREKVCPAIRRMFGVPEFGADDAGRPTGLTEDELLELLADFLNWLADAKKAPGESPTSSTATPGSGSLTPAPSPAGETETAPQAGNDTASTSA